MQSHSDRTISALPLILGAPGCAPPHGPPGAAAARPRTAKTSKKRQAPPDHPPARAVSDGAWKAVLERDVTLRTRSGLVVRGRLLGEDADTVTLVQDGGVVATVAKDDVEELRVGQDDPGPAEPVDRKKDEDDKDDEKDVKKDDEREGFRKSGAYVLLSPGGLSQQFYLAGDSGSYDDYYNDYYSGGDSESHTFFQWGLGVGGYIAARGALAIAVGGAFQHATGKLIDGLRANVFRVGPELRLGGSGKHYFAYGLLDVHGLAHRLTFKGDGESESFTLGGVGATFGGGAMGLIGKRFMLGGELKVPVDYLFEKDGDGFTFGDLTMVAVDVRFLLGVKF